MMSMHRLAAISTLLLASGCAERSQTGATAGGASLNPARVPEHLRELLPLAERWGIGDDVDRGRALERATEAERQELRQAVAEHGAEITKWLDSFGSGAAMSDEAAAFMYMQLAVEELPE
jgi:hypothetical protein